MLVLVSPLLTNDVSILFFPLPLHLLPHPPPPFFGQVQHQVHFIVLLVLARHIFLRPGAHEYQ